MIKKILQQWQNSHPNLRVLIVGMLFLGINQGILNSTFNNYLYDMFSLNPSERGFVEFPREFPGFALIFVTGLLAAFSMRSWAIMVGLLSAVGVVGLGFLSPSIALMTVWMLFWSLADHLFMPIEGSLGLQLAKKNNEGQRLGQLSAARNLAMIGGTGLVAIIASILPKDYRVLYGIAAVFAIISSLTFSKLSFNSAKENSPRRFVFRKKYWLYYVLNILFGARKQVFLTFGPWVLISIFKTPPETIGLLLMISAAISVVFRQALGVATDILGERKVLLADALIFLGICLGFVFSQEVYFLFILYILDNLMFSARIARTTYLNKITTDKSELAPTLSLGVTVDHAVSMTIPIIGGFLWQRFGPASVFWGAGVVAIINFIFAFGTTSKART